MTTLGKPFLVKRIARDCDGRCGGSVVVVTDGARWAYALTVDTTDGYVPQDNLVDIADGVVSVSCQAIHGRSEDTCDGGFEVSTSDLAALPWQADDMTRWMEDVTR
jgi:hypothetical protein